MRISRTILALAVCSVVAYSAADPVEQAISLNFIGLLKSNVPTPRRFDPKLAPKFDTAALSSWISKNGIVFSAPEYKKDRNISVEQLSKQISSRTGECFRTFAHISFLISHNMPQYSKQHFEQRGAIKVLCISSFYELEFVSESGAYKLSKVRDVNSND